MRQNALSLDIWRGGKLHESQCLSLSRLRRRDASIKHGIRILRRQVVNFCGQRVGSCRRCGSGVCFQVQEAMDNDSEVS